MGILKKIHPTGNAAQQMRPNSGGETSLSLPPLGPPKKGFPNWGCMKGVINSMTPCCYATPNGAWASNKQMWICSSSMRVGKELQTRLGPPAEVGVQLIKVQAKQQNKNAIDGVDNVRF